MTRRELLYQKINRKRDLSYRFYKKLNSKEQKIYTKSKLPPMIGCIALKHRVIVGCSLERSIKWALRNYKKYYNFLVHCHYYRKPIEKKKYALKELLFQGWVPKGEYPMDENKYHYLVTSTMINGKFYVYPRRYRDHGKGFRDINHHYIGLSGYTRILYKKRWRQ